MSFNPANCTINFAFQDGYQTTLSAGITASDTVIPLTTLPTNVEGTLVIEPGTANEEEIYFTSKATGVVNCPSAAAGRGVNSTAVSHNSGVAVKMLITKASLDAIKYGGALIQKDGWMQANETWVYDSAFTITVPTGAASKYSVGDKIKLTANSVVLYAYIITVADTLLTVVGNALTEHAFTANYYSKVESPVGFPQWFDYTPVFTGFSSDPGVTQAKFSINGRTCHTMLLLTVGTSNAVGFAVTLPVVSTNYTYTPLFRVKNNNTYAAGEGQGLLSPGSATLNCYPDGNLGNWVASAGKLANVSITYGI